jgi:small-conductance mechanosensitive channel
MDALLDLFEEQPLVLALARVLGSLLAAWLIELIISKALARIAAKTKTDADDKIVEIIRRPIFLTVLLWGVGWGGKLLLEDQQYTSTLVPLLETITILLWSIAGTRISEVVLKTIAAKDRPRSMLQTRTLPVFDIFMRVVIVSGAMYFMFLAWEIDLTAWMASAGVVGIAFGLAAKDTIANLFSGIFILADGPYKVKDWIVLDDKLRGEVTHIGIRSTRILTPDEIEVTVPNAIIGNAQLVNETGGPHVRQRLRIPFSVAYGSNVDQVRAVVLGSLDGAPHIRSSPTPVTRFRALGSSGLEFEMWVWIDDPQVRELVIDEVATRIYNSLTAAKIEIPYSKHDVYIRGMVAPPSRPDP